jgi:hypothetical protein
MPQALELCLQVAVFLSAPLPRRIARAWS